MIIISNNKRKSLKEAQIIINLDFENDQIKKYKINENAIIINCIQKKLDLNCFNGIIINDVEIAIDNREEYNLLYDDFLHKHLYYSFLKDKTNRVDMVDLNINCLYGINGKIDEKELINISKNIDKLKNLN